jgi:hypothetical protein
MAQLKLTAGEGIRIKIENVMANEMLRHWPERRFNGPTYRDAKGHPHQREEWFDVLLDADGLQVGFDIETPDYGGIDPYNVFVEVVMPYSGASFWAETADISDWWDDIEDSLITAISKDREAV